jgi:hypothetical protein
MTSAIRENPAFSSWDISSGHRGFDLPPSTMSKEANHGIPNPAARAASLAGRVRIRRRADRYSSSARRIQNSALLPRGRWNRCRVINRARDKY